MIPTSRRTFDLQYAAHFTNAGRASASWVLDHPGRVQEEPYPVPVAEGPEGTHPMLTGCPPAMLTVPAFRELI